MEKRSCWITSGGTLPTMDVRSFCESMLPAPMLRTRDVQFGVALLEFADHRVLALRLRADRDAPDDEVLLPRNSLGAGGPEEGESTGDSDGETSDL